MARWVRILAVVGAAVAVMVGVAACGGDDDEATGTDGDAGSLTVYSGRNEALVSPLLERFTEETGIELNVRYGDTAEMAATILEEGDRSPADVFFGQDAGALGALQKEGLLSELPQATLDKVDARFRSSAGDWVGTSARARVIAYDNRELDEAEVPDSVLDLTGDEWKGKVGWVPTNASFQAFVTAMRAELGDEAAEQWLKDMVANDAQVYENNVVLRDAIANGEVPLGLLNHYYVAAARADADEPEKYPVSLKFPAGGDVGALVNVAGGGVVASSEKQTEARLLIDFLLSEEAQTYFAEETKEYPLIEGVPVADGLPPLASIEQPDVDLADLDDLRGTLEIIENSGAL